MPAELAQVGGRKGKIAPGYDADLTVFDPDAWFDVKSSDLHDRHRISPYVGSRLRGKVMGTFVRGRAVYEDSIFADDPIGAEV
jgi:allantoinase